MANTNPGEKKKIFALRSPMVGCQILSEDEISLFQEVIDAGGVLEELSIPDFEQSIKGVVVALDEEYGYRYWVWETGMDVQSLKVFFSNMNALDYFLNPRNLPGKLHSAELILGGLVSFDSEQPDNEGLFRFFSGQVKAHIHGSDDSWIAFGDEVITPKVIQNDE
jgi:hypothetical protein